MWFLFYFFVFCNDECSIAPCCQMGLVLSISSNPILVQRIPLAFQQIFTIFLWDDLSRLDISYFAEQFVTQYAFDMLQVFLSQRDEAISFTVLSLLHFGHLILSGMLKGILNSNQSRHRPPQFFYNIYLYRLVFERFYEKNVNMRLVMYLQKTLLCHLRIRCL